MNCLARSAICSLIGFWVGLATLGIEMLALAFLNNTAYEPPHLVSFALYPQMYGIAFFLGLFLLVLTWIVIVLPLDQILFALPRQIVPIAIFCGLFGVTTGFVGTFLCCSDFLLSSIVGIYWGVAAITTALTLWFMHRTERDQYVNE
jgi:hypothetical protein